MQRFKNSRLHIFELLRSLKTHMHSSAVIQICFIFCAAISIYFNIRIPVNQNFAFFLGEIKDFVINFFYLSDIIAIIAFIAQYKTIFRRKLLQKAQFFAAYTTLIILLAATSYLVNFEKLSIPIISIFYLLYLAKGIVLHETVKHSKTGIQNYILRVIWVFGLFEAFISLVQFSNQAPIGLRLLGEPTFGPYLWQIAKVEAVGQIFTRPYGTFSHPNILSAFLLLTFIVSLYYYYSQTSNQLKHWLYLFFTQITIVALFMSFSRAAWIAAALTVGLFHVFTWNILRPNKLQLIIRMWLISAALGLLLILTYQPFVQQRGNVLDKAYKERVSYNAAAISIIKQHPLFGVGPSESVLHMEQLLAPNTKPWEIQPIHNYYLLLSAEIGLPVALLFVIYFGFVLNKLHSGQKRATENSRLKGAMLFCGLIGCAVLMLFDHYFYTIQASALLFWTWGGLAAAFAGEKAEKTS